MTLNDETLTLSDDTLPGADEDEDCESDEDCDKYPEL
jgi:hypothetical protein